MQTGAQGRGCQHHPRAEPTPAAGMMPGTESGPWCTALGVATLSSTLPAQEDSAQCPAGCAELPWAPRDPNTPARLWENHAGSGMGVLKGSEMGTQKFKGEKKEAAPKMLSWSCNKRLSEMKSNFCSKLQVVKKPLSHP